MKQPVLNVTDTLSASAAVRYMAPFAGTWAAAGVGDLTPVLTNGEVCTAAGTIDRLLVQRISASNGGNYGPGPGITETLTFYVNNVATGLTVSFADSEFEATDYVHAATVAVGDVVTVVRTVTGGTPADITFSVSYVFEGTVALRSTHGANFTPSTSSVHYISPFNGRSSSASAVAHTSGCIVGAYGSLTYQHVKLQTAPGVGKSWTFDLLQNNVAIAGATITIADTATEGTATFEQAVLPLIMTAGVATSPADELSLKITPSGGPASTRVSYGVRFDAEPLELVDTDTMDVVASITDNISNHCVNMDSLASSNDILYAMPPLTSPAVNYFARDGKWTNINGVDFNVVLYWMAVHLKTVPGGTSQRAFTPMHYNATPPPPFLPSLSPVVIISGTNYYNGTQTVGGTDQFSGYPATGNQQIMTVRQVGTGFPASTVVWTAFMLVASGFASGAPVFDGTVVSITPDNGPIAGGTAFTIVGTGFQGTVNSGAHNITGVSSVTLRGIAATSVVVVNGTHITGVSGASTVTGVGDVVITFTTDIAGGPTARGLLEAAWTYTDVARWWVADDPGISGPGTGPTYFYGTSPPSGVTTPGGTLTWVPAPDPPEPFGWWMSNEGLAGAPLVADGTGSPKPPRTPDQVVNYATGASKHLQGQPGIAGTFRNKLIYAGGDYLMGTEGPTLRLYDGSADRQLHTLPGIGGFVSDAIMSMLVANGKTYVTSLDHNATGGRVFEFDLDTATFTPMGFPFTSNEVPYAMVWHQGKLWMGTNKHSGAATQLYSIRPSEPLNWQTEHANSINSVGGVCSLASYQGKLYIGTDNISTAHGKVLVRDSLGVYTVSETGTGTAAMNGYVAMLVFKDKLYAAYWDSAASTSLIRRFNGSAWSTVYTGATTTAFPILSLFEHDNHIYALFGTPANEAALIRSETGDSGDYDDLTAFLPPGGILPTPAFATLRL